MQDKYIQISLHKPIQCDQRLFQWSSQVQEVWGRFFNEPYSVLSDSRGLRFQVFHSFWRIKKFQAWKKKEWEVSKPPRKWKWQQPYKSAFTKSLALESDVFEFLRFSMYCYFKNWFSLFRPQSCNSILRIRRCVHKALLLFSAWKKTVSARFFAPVLHTPSALSLHRDHRPSRGKEACQWPIRNLTWHLCARLPGLLSQAQ